MTRDQDRLRQSTRAYKTLGQAADDIAERLEHVHSAAAPQAPRRPGSPPSSSDGPADPVHTQVAQLEEHLRRRGGPLHRIALLLDNLDELAQAIDADHRLPEGFVAQVASLRPSIRRGPVGAPLHALGALAGQIGDQLNLLNETIFDRWRQLWRDGEDRHVTVVDQALLTYSSDASYAAEIARGLAPFAPAEPVGYCACGPECCPEGCNDRLWKRGRRISDRCHKARTRANRRARTTT
jgi:hypothetical protein